MDERHAVRSRLSDPLGIGQHRLPARKGCLLRVGDIRHQAQIVAYGMADGLGSTELPQTLRALRKDVRALRQTQPRERTLREGLNLSGVENSLHDSSVEPSPDDASRPNPASPSPESWRVRILSPR